MRNALSGAAQLPFRVAAGLTDEAVHQAEGFWPGSGVEAPHDPSQLYHESSVQMRDREQHNTSTVEPIAEGRSQEGAVLDPADTATPALGKVVATEPANVASGKPDHQSQHGANLEQGEESDMTSKAQALDAGIPALAAGSREKTGQQHDLAGQPADGGASKDALEHTADSRRGSSASLSHQDTTASSSVSTKLYHLPMSGKPHQTLDVHKCLSLHVLPCDIAIQMYIDNAANSRCLSFQK